eukprot:Gb_30589 [translate_table: standard]
MQPAAATIQSAAVINDNSTACTQNSACCNKRGLLTVQPAITVINAPLNPGATPTLEQYSLLSQHCMAFSFSGTAFNNSAYTVPSQNPYVYSLEDSLSLLLLFSLRTFFSSEEEK